MHVRGEEVFASQVDTLLQDHPDVRSCATFDAPGPEGTGLYTAVVRVSGAQLRAWLVERVGGLAVPDTVLFVDRLPLTYAHELYRDTLRSWTAQPALPPARA